MHMGVRVSRKRLVHNRQEKYVWPSIWFYQPSPPLNIIDRAQMMLCILINTVTIPGTLGKRQLASDGLTALHSNRRSRRESRRRRRTTRVVLLVLPRRRRIVVGVAAGSRVDEPWRWWWGFAPWAKLWIEGGGGEEEAMLRLVTPAAASGSLSRRATIAQVISLLPPRSASSRGRCLSLSHH